MKVKIHQARIPNPFLKSYVLTPITEGKLRLRTPGWIVIRKTQSYAKDRIDFKVRFIPSSEKRKEAEPDCNLRILNENRESDKENKGEVDESMQVINVPGESQSTLQDTTLKRYRWRAVGVKEQFPSKACQATGVERVIPCIYPVWSSWQPAVFRALLTKYW